MCNKQEMIDGMCVRGLQNAGNRDAQKTIEHTHTHSERVRHTQQ